MAEEFPTRGISELELIREFRNACAQADLARDKFNVYSDLGEFLREVTDDLSDSIDTDTMSLSLKRYRNTLENLEQYGVVAMDYYDAMNRASMLYDMIGEHFPNSQILQSKSVVEEMGRVGEAILKRRGVTVRLASSTLGTFYSFLKCSKSGDEASD